METLEFRLRMAGYPALDAATWRILMDEGTLQFMSSDQAARLLGEVALPAAFIYQARVQEAGIFLTSDWVVIVRAQSVLHSVSVVFVLLSLISETLDTPVSIDLITLQEDRVIPLHRYLARQAALTKVKRTAIWVTTLLVTAAVSALVGIWLAGLLSGG